MKRLSSPAILSMMSFVFMLAAGIALSVPQARRHDPNRPEAIPIVVSPQGFTQQSFYLPQGPYAFVVINRTGLHSITVHLERMAGNLVNGPVAGQEFGDRIGDRALHIVRSARLNPGTYRLRVDDIPNWVAEIQVR